MAHFFKSDELVARGDGGEGGVHFGKGTEGVAGAVDEQGWRLEPRKVTRAELLRFARRMQRIGEEQERVGDAGRLRREKRRLAAAIRMASENDERRGDLAHSLGGAQQAFAINFGPGASIEETLRRAGGALLAVRKIAAQNMKTGTRKGFGDRHQQRRIAVGPRAVRDHETSLKRFSRFVQPSADQFALKTFHTCR